MHVRLGSGLRFGRILTRDIDRECVGEVGHGLLGLAVDDADGDGLEGLVRVCSRGHDRAGSCREYAQGDIKRAFGPTSQTSIPAGVDSKG